MGARTLPRTSVLVMACLVVGCGDEKQQSTSGETETGTSSTGSTSISTRGTGPSGTSTAATGVATSGTSEGSQTSSSSSTEGTAGTAGTAGSTGTGAATTTGTTGGTLCGNGMLDPGEACDDGNLDPTDLCLPDCTMSPLLVWYDFEGDAQNLGGEPGYDGVVADTASYVAGKVGMALACGGQGPNVTIPGLRDLLVAHPSVTVGVWVREDPALAYTSLLDLRMASPSGTGFETYHGIDPNAGFVTCVSGAGGFIGCETFPASAGTWHHVTWRYAGTGMGPGEGAPVEIFLDGQLAASVANPAMDPVLTDELDADGYLCGLWGAGGTEVNFEIDAFKIWGAVFAPSQQCEMVVGGTWENGVCVPP